MLVRGCFLSVTVTLRGSGWDALLKERLVRGHRPSCTWGPRSVAGAGLLLMRARRKTLKRCRPQSPALSSANYFSGLGAAVGSRLEPWMAPNGPGEGSQGPAAHAAARSHAVWSSRSGPFPL